MKFAYKLTFAIFALELFLSGCGKPDIPTSQLKEKLLGEWCQILHEAKGDTYVFSSNDTIYLKSQYDNDIYAMSYHITNENIIEVKRLWDNASDKISRHTVSFLPNDTLLLDQFASVNNGVTEVADIKLVKNHTDQLEKRLIGKWQLVGEGYYDDHDVLIMNSLEDDGRYIEFREDLNMVRPTTYEPIRPYRTEGHILFENYLDEDNMFIYQFGIIDNVLILKYLQGNMPDIPRQIVVFKYEKV
ncbi:MAG: hypothetical protein NC048_03380 [Bacteroides sp.]|nr:hypothetical protein [Ruminococcus flavefaciens]MCM1554517.1 hypothetical protein [Bacteroides sp.]